MEIPRRLSSNNVTGKPTRASKTSERDGLGQKVGISEHRVLNVPNMFILFTIDLEKPGTRLTLYRAQAFQIPISRLSCGNMLGQNMALI